MKKTMFTVWVGGSEMNSHYLNKEDAERIAMAWRDFGYDDVSVDEVMVSA
jgi:hypothetical protein